MAQQSLIDTYTSSSNDADDHSPPIPPPHTTILFPGISDDDDGGPIHRTFMSAASLANLLPTGTVLGFQALIPSFTNGGTCHNSNIFLTTTLIIICSLLCFLSSFTDSFKGHDGKVHYGIATFRGFYVFNAEKEIIDDGEIQQQLRDDDINVYDRYKIKCIDFVHAAASLVVFLVFAVSDSDVLGCLFPEGAGVNENQLIINMPLGIGILATFLFMVFPTTRRGIGYDTGHS